MLLSLKLSDFFPQFKKFPPEIRDMIWEAALPPPRWVRYQYKLLTTLPAPNVAHVCKESRIIALKQGSRHAFQFPGDWKRFTWFCPSQDTLCVGIEHIDELHTHEGNQDSHSSPLFPVVEHVAFAYARPVNGYPDESCDHWADLAFLQTYLSHVLNHMRNVKVVNLSLAYCYLEYIWKHKTARTILGSGNDRIVDLTDEKEVEDVSKVFSSSEATESLAGHLLRSQKAVQGVSEEDKNKLDPTRSWGRYMELVKRNWHQGRRSGYDKSTNIDGENDWVKSLPAELPQIRPVFIFQTDDRSIYHPKWAERQYSDFEGDSDWDDSDPDYFERANIESLGHSAKDNDQDIGVSDRKVKEESLGFSDIGVSDRKVKEESLGLSDIGGSERKVKEESLGFSDIGGSDREVKYEPEQE